MSLLQMSGLMLVAVTGLMTLVWLVSLVLRDSSIVDIFWGTGFVILAWIVYRFTPQGFADRKILICSLVTLWGIRLSIHILRRNWGKEEDYRYQKWRNEAGTSWWWRSYFKVFLLQGFLMWIIATPLLVAQAGPQPQVITGIDLIGVVVWAVGFFFETVGDLQLTRFKSDPDNKGKVLQSGVWRYTRHPNYFGDATQWWGFFLIAAVAGGWWTIFSPILMTILLLKVSGVALLESNLKKNKPGYQDYVQRTSAFVPWFPRRESKSDVHSSDH